MLRSCSRCGGYHEPGACPRGEPIRQYKPKPDNEAVRLRGSSAWKRKRLEILKRDNYCCKLCLLDGVLNNHDLQVHHIIPILEDEKLKLVNNNLISLCSMHHSIVEDDKEYIPILQKLVNIPPVKILKKN